MPALFAVCFVLVDDSQMAMFAAFGALAMLSFADFGGPLRRRGTAYLGLTAVGAALITIATLVSNDVVLAVAGMAIAAFAIAFSGVFGGYIAAAGTAAMLSFVLAVSVPVPADEIRARLTGWCLAGIASTAAALLLWPKRHRAAIRRAAGDSSLAVAALIDAVVADGDRDLLDARRKAAADAAQALRSGYAAAPFRPAGPTVHDQSLGYLVRELAWIQTLGDDLAAARGVEGALRPEDARLASAVAVTLRDTAEALAGRADRVDLGALEQARTAQAEATEHALTEVVAKPGGLNRACELVRRSFATRVLSYAGLSVGASADLLQGDRAPAAEYEIGPLVPDATLSGTARRFKRIVLGHLRPDSVWLQAGVRAAVGLGLAVLIARVGDLQHAFWVALAVLSVLKSNSAGTRHTAWQSVLGTVIGFGVASAFVEVASGSSTAYWVALPIATFLCVYTPTAVHFVVGQAMFTVTVVILFDLIQPDGWRTGLIRVEDIAIGAGTSVVVIALLWPRGAYGQLRARIGALFEACGDHVESAFDAHVGVVDVGVAREAGLRSLAAATRASEAFSTFLNESGPKRLAVEVPSDLLLAAARVRFAGDAITALVRSEGPIPVSRGVRNAVETETHDLATRIRELGRSLLDQNSRSPPDLQPPSPAAPRIFALAEADGVRQHDIVRIAWPSEWLDYAGRVLAEIDGPARELLNVGTLPWWR